MADTRPAGALTLDLGNTNASLALTRLGGAGDAPSVTTLVASGPSTDLRWLGDVLDGLDDPADGLRVAGVSAVGPHAHEDEAAAILAAHATEVFRHPEPGLVFDIRFPETCGSDRKYAMRAALGEARAAGGTRALVVDVGTALTVDAGEWRGPDAVFLGGAIAPGPGTSARALSLAGARLPEFELDPAAHALGRSTDEALVSGIVVGFRGAVRELVNRVTQEAFGGPRGVHLFVTGGARHFAEAALEDFGGAALVEDPLLVHRGLALASAL